MKHVTAFSHFEPDFNIEIGGVMFPFLHRCDGTTHPITGVVKCCPGHHIFDHHYQHHSICIFEHTVPVCALRILIGKYIRKCFDANPRHTAKSLTNAIVQSPTWEFICARLLQRPWLAFRCWQCNKDMELIRGCPNLSVDDVDMQLNEPDAMWDSDLIVHIPPLTECE